VAAIVATNIGPLTEQEEFLPNTHPMMILLKEVGEEFPSATNTQDSILVNWNWGIKGLDRSNVGLWDSADIGELEWDDTFTVKSAES